MTGRNKLLGPVAGQGTILGLSIGCLEEPSPGFKGACLFIARNRALS